MRISPFLTMKSPLVNAPSELCVYTSTETPMTCNQSSRTWPPSGDTTPILFPPGRPRNHPWGHSLLCFSFLILDTKESETAHRT